MICNKFKPAVFDPLKSNYHLTASVLIQRTGTTSLSDRRKLKKQNRK